MKRPVPILAAAAALGLAAHAASAADFKRGFNATSLAGCAALKRQDPGKRLDADDIVGGGVRDTDANVLVIEAKTLGSADFECAIGKPKRKGKATEWPLACAGESSGGPKSAMRAPKPGDLTFTGGLADWGTAYFCR